jgi:sulfopyruvate decarboxylase subunit alpha
VIYQETRQRPPAPPAPDGGPTAVDAVARVVARDLVSSGLGPFLATPCGVLAPLLSELGSRLITVPREETAVGVAAGAALAGRRPVVLMQNSGFGASVNALASLVQAYTLPLLLVVSLRGAAPDNTDENRVMGRVTGPMLDLLGIGHRTLHPDRLSADVEWATTELSRSGRTQALLVPPTLFGWMP